jgi:hypothetical protein
MRLLLGNCIDKLKELDDNPYNEEKEEKIELNKNSQKFW